jgi:hypothetical protein
VKNKAKGFYKNFDKRVDKELFRSMIESYIANAPKSFQANIADLIKKYKTVDNWAEVIYSKSMLTSEENLNKLLDNFSKDGLATLKKDPFVILSQRKSDKQKEKSPAVKK